MAPRPPPPPLPNPDNSHLVGTIEAMIVAMQQQNANMVNQHNLALQQMESARLAAKATQQTDGNGSWLKLGHCLVFVLSKYLPYLCPI